MNAKEARRLAEKFIYQPEIDECIALIKRSVNRGEFSTTINEMKPSTKNHLEKEGYKVQWYDFQMSDGYWEISW